MQTSLSATLFAALLLASTTAPTLTPARAQTAAGAKATAPVAATNAQTPTTPQTQPGQPGQPGTMDELNAIVKIHSRPKTPTPLPENQPVPLDLSLVNVPDVPKPLLEGVTGNGFARYVTVEDKLVGQMVLAGVSKDGKVEALETTKFATQFPLKATTLSAEEPVVIEGDKVQLIEALKRLQGEPKEDDKKDGKDGKDSSSRTAFSNANGSGSANPDAAAYRTPEPGTLPEKEAAPAAAPTVDVSEDGCPIRVDVGQMVAIQQNKTITVIDGQRTETPCEDGGTRYQLQASYLNCTYKIDTAAMTATARKRLYYVDKTGTSVPASDCTEDPEAVFPIVEDVAACPILLDYPKEKAVPQAVLTYTDRLNAKVQVRDCDDAKTAKPVPLVRTSDGCTIRHDFAGGKSYRQARYTYTLGGVQYDAGYCADTGEEYRHTAVYTDAGGTAICPAIIRQDIKAAVRQYRTMISVGGSSQYINDCTPDTTTLAITTTADGCDDPSTWTHDLSAGVSYEMVRDYYLLNGKREYVSGCHIGTKSYPHQITAAGWDNNDANRTAIQKSKVTIAAPKGEYVITASTVLPGTTALPYSYIGQGVTPTGTSVYDGCSAYRNTSVAEQYRRPDGTTYNRPIGAGSAQYGGNVCDKILIGTRNFVVASNRYFTQTIQQAQGGEATREVWTAFHQLVRQDAARYMYRNRETGNDITAVVEWLGSPVTHPQIVKSYEYASYDWHANTRVYEDQFISIGTRDFPELGNGFSTMPEMLQNVQSRVTLSTPPTNW